MFRVCHTTSETRYKNLKSNLRSHGLATQSHSNLKCCPAHVMSLSFTEFVFRFLLYAEHALFLPGRVPGYCISDMKLLPSSVSKHGIWKVYQEASRSDSMCAVGYFYFVDPSYPMSSWWSQWPTYAGSVRRRTQQCSNLPTSQRKRSLQQWCLQKSTWELCRLSDRLIQLPVKIVPGPSRPTSRPSLFSLPLLLLVTFLPLLMPSNFTTAFIMNSRFVLTENFICVLPGIVRKINTHLFHIM